MDFCCFCGTHTHTQTVFQSTKCTHYVGWMNNAYDLLHAFSWYSINFVAPNRQSAAERETRKKTPDERRQTKAVGEERKKSGRWIKRAIYRMESRDEIKLNDFVCANGWMISAMRINWYFIRRVCVCVCLCGFLPFFPAASRSSSSPNFRLN